jgi:hypothetical protein
VQRLLYGEQAFSQFYDHGMPMTEVMIALSPTIKLMGCLALKSEELTPVVVTTTYNECKPRALATKSSSLLKLSI